MNTFKRYLTMLVVFIPSLLRVSPIEDGSSGNGVQETGCIGNVEGWAGNSFLGKLFHVEVANFSIGTQILKVSAIEIDNYLIGTPEIDCHSDTIEMKFRTKRRFTGVISTFTLPPLTSLLSLLF